MLRKAKAFLGNYQVLTNTISLMSILSSNVALKAPSGELNDFLIIPLIPDTVLIAAPSNLATSRALLNIPLMKAVLWNTCWKIFLNHEKIVNVCRQHKLYKNWTTVEYFFTLKIGRLFNYFLIKISLPTPFDKKHLSNPSGPLIYCKDSSRPITLLSLSVKTQKV